jgi:thioredoxin reductase (NADPH)
MRCALRLSISVIASLRGEQLEGLASGFKSGRYSLDGGFAVETSRFLPSGGKSCAKVRSELAIRLGASVNKNGCLIVDEKQRTSVQHLYAAGDVTLELHPLAVSFGQAAIAATDIHNSLAPNYR